MKKFFAILALTLFAVTAFAQASSLFRPRMEVVETSSDEDGDTALSVFYMNDESPRVYYLSLGHVGVGSDVIQVNVDPVSELFIPLGGNLDEAIGKMQEILEYYKMPRQQSTEMTGSFAALYPKPDEPLALTVTSRAFLLTKLLEFSFPANTEGLLRVTHVARSDFNALLSSLKFYKRLHPDE